MCSRDVLSNTVMRNVASTESTDANPRCKMPSRRTGVRGKTGPAAPVTKIEGWQKCKSPAETKGLENSAQSLP